MLGNEQRRRVSLASCMRLRQRAYDDRDAARAAAQRQIEAAREAVSLGIATREAAAHIEAAQQQDDERRMLAIRRYNYMIGMGGPLRPDYALDLDLDALLRGMMSSAPDDDLGDAQPSRDRVIPALLWPPINAATSPGAIVRAIPRRPGAPSIQLPQQIKHHF